MEWKLSHGTQPTYVKLVTLITDAIETGDLISGEKLPVERELAKRLMINRSTIQRAFSELVSRGILVRKMGSGTWVNSGKWGVLNKNINWQSYLGTNRLGDPDNFMTELRKLEKENVINLSHSSPNNRQEIVQFNLSSTDDSADITGSFDLKKQLQSHLNSYLSQDIQSTNILITSGAQQAFYLIAQGLLSYGDAIAIENPSYFYQLSMFQATGIRVFAIPFNHDGGLDLDILRQMYYQHHLRFLFINPTGQNPTGITMPLSERKKLVDTCLALKLPIVEDDPFGLTNAVTNVEITPLKLLSPENVIYVGSLSTISGSNTRVGWMIAPPQLINHLAQIRQEMEAGISIYPQLLTSELLKNKSLKPNLIAAQSTLSKRRNVLFNVLQRLVDLDLIDFKISDLGNNFWVHLHVNRTLSPSDYKIFLRDKILVRPGFLFGINENYIRISFTNFETSWSNDLFTQFKAIILEFRR